MQAKRLVTIEELWAMPEPLGVRYELVAGRLVEQPGAVVLRGLIMGQTYSVIEAFVTEGDRGLMFVGGPGYILARAPDTLRMPDVSFISWTRVPEEGIPEGFWPGAPDLAAEVVSPDDRAGDVRDRVREYLAAGTRLVWVLLPKRQAVTVHAPGGIVRELGPDEELDGGDVLPGFRARVADLFAVQWRR